MITEERAVEMFTEANPMPRADTIDVRDSGAAYLDALMQRSSEMVQTDKRQDSAERNRSGAWLWVAAAVIVAVIGVALILMNQSESEPPPATQPAPTTPTTEADVDPTTTVATETTLGAAEEAWLEVPLLLGEGQGTFRSNLFGVPFKYDTGEAGWAPDIFQSEEVFAIYRADPMALFVHALYGGETVDDTVRSFADWQAAYADTTTMSEPVPTDVGGASGVMFEMTDMPFEGSTPGPYVTPDGYARAGGELAEVYVVDVNGQIVVIIHQFARNYPGEAVPGYTDEEYAAANESARALVDSIVWKDLQ